MTHALIVGYFGQMHLLNVNVNVMATALPDGGALQQDNVPFDTSAMAQGT